MEHVRIDHLDNAVQPAAVMRRLTEPLSASDVAVNYYELAPGDSFAFAYHAHGVQEELFVVLEGTATWETADGTREVAAGEIIRFDTGEFQRGWNHSTDRVRALAVGAPLAYGDQPKFDDCPACGDRQPVAIGRPDDDPSAVHTTCQTCETEIGRWEHGPDGENQRVTPED